MPTQMNSLKIVVKHEAEGILTNICEFTSTAEYDIPFLMRWFLMQTMKLHKIPYGNVVVRISVEGSGSGSGYTHDENIEREIRTWTDARANSMAECTDDIRRQLFADVPTCNELHIYLDFAYNQCLANLASKLAAKESLFINADVVHIWIDRK
jgi:hypothetical protein